MRRGSRGIPAHREQDFTGLLLLAYCISGHGLMDRDSVLRGVPVRGPGCICRCSRSIQNGAGSKTPMANVPDRSRQPPTTSDDWLERARLGDLTLHAISP